jgi:multidrug efflux pump subunit AcrA (membrane-fusion protein)
VRRLPMRTLLWGVPLIVAFIAIMAWAMLLSRQAKNESDPGASRSHDRPIPVRTETVTSNVEEDVIGATVATVPSETASIKVGASRLVNTNATPVVLTLKALHAHEGDFVRQGQVLCEFEEQGFQELVHQKTATLESAKATLKRVQEQLKYNQEVRQLSLQSAQDSLSFRKDDLASRDKEQEIFRGLSQNGAASIVQYYDSRSKAFEARYNLSEAQKSLQLTQNSLNVGVLRDKEDLAKANNDLLAARVDLDLTQREIAGLQIRSPLDGYVTFEGSGAAIKAPGMGSAAVVEPAAGQFMVPNAPFASVLRLDPIDLVMDYPLERISEVRIGQTAEVVLDAFPKETFNCRVLRIGPVVNSDVRVLPVLLRMDNPQGRVKPGITGFVRIRASREMTTVPSTAVLRQGTTSVVFCVKDGRARLREVHTGRTVANGIVEVTGGLSPGEEVVVFQNFYRHMDDLQGTGSLLKDNDLVDVDWRRWAGRR